MLFDEGAGAKRQGLSAYRRVTVTGQNKYPTTARQRGDESQAVFTGQVEVEHGQVRLHGLRLMKRLCRRGSHTDGGWVRQAPCDQPPQPFAHCALVVDDQDAKRNRLRLDLDDRLASANERHACMLGAATTPGMGDWSVTGGRFVPSQVEGVSPGLNQYRELPNPCSVAYTCSSSRPCTASLL